MHDCQQRGALADDQVFWSRPYTCQNKIEHLRSLVFTNIGVCVCECGGYLCVGFIEKERVREKSIDFVGSELGNEGRKWGIGKIFF